MAHIECRKGCNQGLRNCGQGCATITSILVASKDNARIWVVSQLNGIGNIQKF